MLVYSNISSILEYFLFTRKQVAVKLREITAGMGIGRLFITTYKCMK